MMKFLTKKKQLRSPLAPRPPTSDPRPPPSALRPPVSKREIAVAVLLVLCLLLIAAWEIAAKLAARPFDELILKKEDFVGFYPSNDKWKVSLTHAKATPTDPTAVAYEVKPGSSRLPTSDLRSPLSAPLQVRIVHGYNMVDCMRIKQYKVELIRDRRSVVGGQRSEIGIRDSRMTTDHRPLTPDPGPPTSALPYQLWRITSAGGKVSLWVTTMLKTVDFSATNVDTRDMAFPRIGSPDNPSWAPTGIKWSSLRHPVKNSRDAIRAKWNSSRCDLPTFLRLRQPAWASNEMLTMVTEYHGPSIPPDQEKYVAKYILRAHAFMLKEFQKFWRGKPAVQKLQPQRL